MKSKRLITTGLAMLTVMSVFATNNAGAQDAVSSLLGGTISLITFIIFAVLYFIWYFFVAIMARKEKQKRSTMDFLQHTRYTIVDDANPPLHW